MDEMKIQSKFMTGLVSRIVKKVLRTKLGCEVDIQLNEFRTTVIDDMLLDELEDWQEILDLAIAAGNTEIQKKAEKQIAKINEKLKF